MIRLLLDQGLPRGTASHLQREGWDVVHVGEIGMSRATDQEILDYARQENRVCVTLDADFHALLVLGSERSPSVVRIRIEGLHSNSHFGNFAHFGLRRSGVDLGDGRLSSLWESNRHHPTGLEAVEHKGH